MASISRDSKSRNKKQLSFREFEGSTNDAWEDIDDDIIKLSSSPSHDPDGASQSQSRIPLVRIMIIYFIVLLS